MKRTRLNHSSKTESAKLRKKCIELVKQIVSIRDGDVCQRCEQRVYGSNRHRSHVIPVSAGNALAYDPINLKILCYHCHMNWWHKNPLEADVWFREKFPERAKYLDENKGTKPMKLLDWKELKIALESEIEIMK